MLVQQGVWHMSKESMPLAAGHLAAMVRASPVLSSWVDVEIKNFPGRVSSYEMALELVRAGAPDVAAFSVLGWNYRQF